MSKKQTLPRWDLKEYYKGLNDPKLKKDKNFLKTAGEKFVSKYKGKINAKTLYPAIKELEKIYRTLEHMHLFLSSVYDTDMTNDEKGGAVQEIKEIDVELEKNLMFFDLEIKKLSKDDFKKCVNLPQLKDYKYFLENIYRFKKYTLSENEEKILADKNLAASMAWQRLYGETNSTLEFEVKIKNKTKKMNLGEIISLGYGTDRKISQQASQEMGRVFAEKSRLYAQIYNSIVLDKNQTNKVRGYEQPEENRIMSDQNDAEVVDLLEKVTLKNYHLCAKHYDLKKKILKTDKLHEYDRYVSLNLSKDKKYSFQQAKEIVLNSFKEFDVEFYSLAKKFFDENWIDAPNYSGKRGGAYCEFGSEQKNPRVLLNFTGDTDDVLTMSHEIGHGIHAIYSQKQNFMNFDCVIPMAEIASIFCENITFDYLLSQTKDEKFKLQTVASKLEGSLFANFFRQMAFYRFEKQMHRLRVERELTASDIDSAWQKELQAMFGKSLTLTEHHKNWWQYISHFFNTPFYVYAYTFGGLISLSLYNKYKQADDKQAFIKSYKELLSSGGNDKPENLLKLVGVDIKDEKFWQGGYEIVKDLIEQEHKMFKKIKMKK